MGADGIGRGRVDRDRSVIDIIQSALDRSPGGYTMDDVRDALRSGDARMWRGPGSAAITEESRVFHIWLAGGNIPGMLQMLDNAETIYRARGFDLVTVSDARPGWERVLKRHGYKRRDMLVKEL